MAISSFTPVEERIPTQDVSVLFRLGAFAFLVSAIVSGVGGATEAAYAVGTGITLLALLVRKRVDAFVVWPTLFLLVLFVSGIAVDSLPNTETTANLQKRMLEFLGGEGRVFLTFFPLLLAAVCRPKSRDLDYIVKLFRWVAWFGVFIATVGQVPPLRGVFYAARNDLLFGLSSSHHVTGFLFGSTGLVLLTTHRGHRRSNIVLGLAMFGVVILTTSRTTIVGLAAATVVALFLRASSYLSRRWLRWFRIGTVAGLAVLFAGQAALGLPILDTETINEGVSSLTSPNTERSYAGVEEKRANTLKRFNLWGESLDLVSTSPLLGIGAFRFNDQVDTYYGSEGLVLFSVGGRRVHEGATAHNAYVHVWVELGLIGLFLLLAIWLGLAIRLNRQRRSPAADDTVRADAESAVLLVAFALGTALTSASLFIPGLCVPVLLYVASIALRGDAPGRGSGGGSPPASVDVAPTVPAA